MSWTSKFFIAMLAGGALFAADGVVLIDQKAALAGGVSPDDTRGFPVTLSQPGVYKLTSNITVPDVTTTAFQITGPDVTLDLNGFSIIGPNVCTSNPTSCTYSGAGGIGIHAGSLMPGGPAAPRGTRIMNGTVRGMGGHGVRVMGTDAIVEKVQSYFNGGPGIVATSGSVLNCVARLNASGAGIVATVARENIVSEHGGGAGLYVMTGGVASGNMVTLNATEGMVIEKATATGNTVYKNGRNGLVAYCPSAIVGNTITDNAGVQVQQVTGVCTMVNNAQ